MDNNNPQANANTNPATGANTDPSQAGTNAQQGTPEKKYTDEDVNDIIARRLAKMQKKHDEEIADIKAKATMNDDQKRSYEAEQKDKALAAAQAELNALKLTQVATKALSAKGYTVDEPLIKIVLQADEDLTLKAVEAFHDIVTKEVNRKLTESARQAAPSTSNPHSRTANTTPGSMKELAAKHRLIK